MEKINLNPPAARKFSRNSQCGRPMIAICFLPDN